MSNPARVECVGHVASLLWEHVEPDHQRANLAALPHLVEAALEFLGCLRRDVGYTFEVERDLAALGFDRVDKRPTSATSNVPSRRMPRRGQGSILSMVESPSIRGWYIR